MFDTYRHLITAQKYKPLTILQQFYMCGSGECVPHTFGCNGYNDCSTTDDEIKCTNVSAENCSPFALDFFEEDNCKRACDDLYVPCGNICITLDGLCDQHYDYGIEGWDEVLCDNHTLISTHFDSHHNVLLWP